MTANYVKAIPAINFDTADLTADLQLIGTLPVACYLLRFTNFCDNPIFISYDGVDIHESCLGADATNAFPIYAQSNSQKRDTAFFKAGTEIWVVGTAGVGFFMVSGYYQPQI